MQRLLHAIDPLRRRFCAAHATAFFIFAAVSFIVLAPSPANADEEPADKLIAAATKIIEAKDSTPAQICQALQDRASAYRRVPDDDKALADYARAIEMKDVPVDLTAGALTGRA